MDWDKRRIAEYSFDFPTYKMRYNERAHFNEDLYQTGDEQVEQDKTVLRDKIFVTTMFGTRAKVLKTYGEDLLDQPEIMLSRAAVFMLN